VQKNVTLQPEVVHKNVYYCIKVVHKNVLLMKRDIYEKLLSWKESSTRMPLILNGARQVGKTWLLTEFGHREYKKLAMFSLDRNEAARKVFEQSGEARELLRKLSALAGIDITAGDTLLFLDEIQDCPRALTALKFFCEETPEIHVAVAGSLLGISLHDQSSYPVGKVDVIRMYPMTFSEFLRAVGREMMAEELDRGEWNILSALDTTYKDLLRQYYYVGGMPAVVKSYAATGQLQDVRRLQKRILADYEADFSKHAPSSEVPRIRMVWNSIPAQLAKENKKFIYGALKPGARASQFEMAIQWLQDAGLVYLTRRVSAVKMPLKFYEDFSAFKLYMLDVGLLGAMMDVTAAAILVKSNIFSEYKGAFTELFVCTQLQVTDIPVYYYTAENSRIEIDFAVQLDSCVYPIEVKAEENLQSKSMKTFIQKHPELTGLRLSMKPWISQGWLECIPLYAFREELIRKNNRQDEIQV
jgi:predicted AAA+ superfamily ATPase